MKTVTVHRGARDGYQVARALQEAGLLETLVTDLYWPEDRTWARSIDSFAPRRASAALRRRRAEGLPSTSVASCWLSGLSSLLAAKAGCLPFNWQRRATRWCDRSLGREAGRIATKTGAALLSYSYYAHSAFSNLLGDQPRIFSNCIHTRRASAPFCGKSGGCIRTARLLWIKSGSWRFLRRTSSGWWRKSPWPITGSRRHNSQSRPWPMPGFRPNKIVVIPYGIDLERILLGEGSPRLGQTSPVALRWNAGPAKGNQIFSTGA